MCIRDRIDGQETRSDEFSYGAAGCGIDFAGNPFNALLTEPVIMLLRFHVPPQNPGSTAGDSLTDTVCRMPTATLGEGSCIPVVTGIFMTGGAILGIFTGSPIGIILGGIMGLVIGVAISSGSVLITILLVIAILGGGALFKLFRR